MTTNRLRAGVAELEITGQAGLELAAELNPRVSKGVRTPLMAKALVLSSGEESLAVVTLDLFGLQGEAANQLAQAISQRCGLRPEAVMLVCSHTRGAPHTTPVVGWPGMHESYVAEVSTRCQRSWNRHRRPSRMPLSAWDTLHFRTWSTTIA